MSGCVAVALCDWMDPPSGESNCTYNCAGASAHRHLMYLMSLSFWYCCYIVYPVCSKLFLTISYMIKSRFKEGKEKKKKTEKEREELEIASFLFFLYVSYQTSRT